MNRRVINKITVVSALVGIFSANAHALTMDWSGYFRADHNFIHDYQMNKTAPGYSRDAASSGEYIPGAGQKSGTFSSVFMKLKPRVLVNDNIIVRSEWNIGDPVYGFFGRNVPKEDTNNPLSTGKGGMELSVARLWLDAHTDFGTLQVGRAPMHWGLGVIFNSADDPFDRYQSTSDTIRLISKFGYLSLMPLYAKNATGRNVVGASNPLTDGVIAGSDDVTDYGIALKYENPEEDLDAGAIYYKRNAPDTQTSYYYPSTVSSYNSGHNGMNLKLLDLYVKKSWRRLTLGAEFPLYSGDIGDVNGVGSRNNYHATALALEATLKYDTWTHSLKMGTVPGQGPVPTGAMGNSFGAMSFHRSYKLGMILFNYNLGNFAGNNTNLVPVNCTTASAGTCYGTNSAVSPYDAAITNAQYLMLATEKHWEQWSISLGYVMAKANETAAAGKMAYNHRTKQWFASNAKQENSMGMEFDFGTRYNWDENISFGADMGLFLPGSYYKYYNNANGYTGPANSVTAITLSTSTAF